MDISASQKPSIERPESESRGPSGYWAETLAKIKNLVRSCAALVLVLPLFFYLALPTRNFYWDGVAFAIDIEKRLPAAYLLHPSHLIYSLAGA